MSELQELSRSLLAAGVIMGEQDENTSTLLFTDSRSSLISKQVTKTGVRKEDLIASSVRPNSKVAYLVPPGRVYIPHVHPQCPYYDDNDETWVNDYSILVLDVHSEGNLAATFDIQQKAYFTFQDAEKHFVYLDHTWKPAVIPCEPIPGSPITTLLVDDKNCIFFISSVNNFIHFVEKGDDGDVSLPTLNKSHRLHLTPHRSNSTIDRVK